MNKQTASSRKRTYNQTARAEAAEATATRLVDAFFEFLKEDWYDDISLDRLAKAAGCTVPTVLRRFGSKEGLLEEVGWKLQRETNARRLVTPGDVTAAVDSVVNDYENGGRLVMRVLAQEDRLPAMKTFADFGRREHRAWITAVFAPQLKGMKPARRELVIDSLVTALDIYVWKVLRIDRGRSPPEVARVMRQFVQGILDGQ